MGLISSSIDQSDTRIPLTTNVSTGKLVVDRFEKDNTISNNILKVDEDNIIDEKIDKSVDILSTDEVSNNLTTVSKSDQLISKNGVDNSIKPILNSIPNESISKSSITTTDLFNCISLCKLNPQGSIFTVSIWCNIFSFIDMKYILLKLSKICKLYYNISLNKDSYTEWIINEYTLNYLLNKLTTFKSDIEFNSYFNKFLSIRSLIITVGKLSYDPLLRKLQTIDFGDSLKSIKLINTFSNIVVSGSYQLFGSLSSQIETFELNAELSDAEFQSLVRSLTKVKILKIEKYIPNDLSLLYISKNCPYLQVLFIDASNISNVGLQNLTSYCQDIEHLNLGYKCNYKISEVGLKYLTDRCKSLVKLEFPQLSRIPQIDNFLDRDDLFSKFSFYQDLSRNLEIINKLVEINICASTSFFVSIPFTNALQTSLSKLTFSKWDNFNFNLISPIFSNVLFLNLQSLSINDIPRKELKNIALLFFDSGMPALEVFSCEIRSIFIDPIIGFEDETFFIEELCNRLSNLSKLRLADFVNIDDKLVDMISSTFKSLTSLELTSSSPLLLTDSSLISISNLILLTNLNINSTNFSDSGVRSIISCINLSCLILPTTINLNYSTIKSLLGAFSFNLKSLCIPSWNCVEHENIEKFILTYTPNLEILHLPENALPTQKAKYLLLTQLDWIAEFKVGNVLMKRELFPSLNNLAMPSNLSYSMHTIDPIAEKYRKANARRVIREEVEWRQEFAMEQTNLDKKVVLGLLMGRGGEYY